MTDKFTGGGLDSLTKAAYQSGYEDGAAAERESMTEDGWRRCAVGQRTTQFCGMLEDAVKAEREKSLKLWMLLDDVDTADDIAKDNDVFYRNLCRIAQQKRWAILNGDEVDAAIRARGET